MHQSTIYVAQGFLTDHLPCGNSINQIIIFRVQGSSEASNIICLSNDIHHQRLVSASLVSLGLALNLVTMFLRVSCSDTTALIVLHSAPQCNRACQMAFTDTVVFSTQLQKQLLQIIQEYRIGQNSPVSIISYYHHTSYTTYYDIMQQPGCACCNNTISQYSHW